MFPIASDSGKQPPGSDRDQAERARLGAKWPDEFADGSQCGYGKPPAGERLKGGYPVGFHFWNLERRNAWWAGFNVGFQYRPQHSRRTRP